jgi:hypothetical protein
MNADYRWPIARPQRGVGTWPIFLHTIHAALFADGGHAWTDVFDVRHAKTSAGVELSANLVLGYGLPMTLTGGMAWARDGARLMSGGRAAYVRIGRAF